MDLQTILTKLKQDERKFAIYFLLGLAIVLGAYVRLYFISHTDYPINDGGLFYRFTSEIVDNGLILPKYSGYNQSNIPIAYPPLGFYLAGFFHLVFDAPLMILVRWIPVVISIITIPVFYLLAKEILEDEFTAGLAVLLFALLPKTYEWYVMGGGLTRAPGFLFQMLAMKFIWRGFSNSRTRTDLLLSILFSGMTVLSHPETALYLVFASLVILFFHGLSKENLFRSLLIGLGVLIVASPWWITILNYHGLEPFLAAGSTGHQQWFRIRYLLTLNFGVENPYFLSLYGVLALLGVFLRNDKKTWYLAFMIVAGYALFPRGGINQLTLIISLLSAVGLDQILYLLDQDDKQDQINDVPAVPLFKTRLSLSFLLFVTIYTFLASVTYKFSLKESVLGLSENSVQAFTWLEQNADKGDKVILYPVNEENRYWWNDFLAEWLPALTDTKSLTTVQGYEWLPELFYESINNYTVLRACVDLASECITEWERSYQEKINYVIITEVDRNPYQADNLLKHEEYLLEFNAGDIYIFSKNETRNE